MPRHLAARLIVALLAVAALAGVPAVARRPAALPVVEVWPRWSGWRDAVEVCDEEFRIKVAAGPTRDRLTVDGRDHPLEGKLADVRRWDAQADPPAARRRLVWKERLGDRARWTVDGVAGPWARDLSAVVFDADGHTWHTATLDGRACVLRDGLVMARFDEILDACRREAAAESDRMGRAADTAPWYVGADRRGRWLATPQGVHGPFQFVGTVVYAPDRRHWACYVRRTGRWALLHDGRLRGWFGTVGLQPRADRPPDGEDPRFGSSANQLIWFSGQGSQRRVWLNDRSWPLRPGSAGEWAWLTDKTGLLWREEISRPGPFPRERWYRNGQVIGEGYGPHHNCGLTTAEHGTGWVLMTRASRTGPRTVHCPLGRFGPYSAADNPCVSNGGRVAWTAVDRDGQERLWIDGHPVSGGLADRYEFERERLVGTQRVAGGRVFYIDGVPGPVVTNDSNDTIGLVERGGHIAYLARDGEQQVLVIDQQVRLRAPELSGLIALDNGHRWRVTTSRPARWPWLDRWQGGPPSTPLDSATTPDGEHRATVETRRGLRGAARHSLRHDGRLMALPGPVNWLVISPDGRHTVCQALGPRPYVVADGRRVLRATLSGQRFSPDGVFLATARPGPETQVVSLRWPATR